jgi:mevalonate kinase
MENPNELGRLSSEQAKQMSILIGMNQSLLCALGVSHQSLDVITNLTSTYYDKLRCTTKLTGAGGGGCAFTFLEDQVSDDNEGNDLPSCSERLTMVSNLIESLAKPCENPKNKWELQCFTSAVGGKGVLWS